MATFSLHFLGCEAAHAVLAAIRRRVAAGRRGFVLTAVDRGCDVAA